MPFIFEEQASAITAKRLQTPLARATWLASDDTPRKAASRLKRRDFDQAPVGLRGDLVGFALRARLEVSSARSVGECMVPLSPDLLVSADAGLPTLLPLLAVTGFVLVLDGHQVSGFVTASDLNKQLARMYFFLLTASLEVFLGSLVRSAYPVQEVALTTLVPRRADGVRGRLARDQEANVALDLVSEMEFRDLLSIATATEAIRAVLGFATKEECAFQLARLPDLRNDVMHPSREFLGRRRDVAKLIEIEQQLRALIARAADRVRRTDRWLAASLMTAPGIASPAR